MHVTCLCSIIFSICYDIFPVLIIFGIYCRFTQFVMLLLIIWSALLKNLVQNGQCSTLFHRYCDSCHSYQLCHGRYWNNFCYAFYFCTLFFQLNVNWRTIWLGSGDDWQSTLFVSHDNSACNLPPCPRYGFRNHMFKTASGGCQCVKGQVCIFYRSCLPNRKDRMEWRDACLLALFCFVSSSEYPTLSSMWQRCCSPLSP